jgi:hypothetical protein
MARFEFKLSSDGKSVCLAGSKSEGERLIVDEIQAAFEASDYSRFRLMKKTLKTALDQFNLNNDSYLELVIASESLPALDVIVSSDQLTATLSITTASGVDNPTAEDILQYLKKQGIVFGISEKMIRQLALKVNEVAPGTTLKVVIARGAAPSESANSGLEWLVTPVQDRVLKPTRREDGTFDMREYGAVDNVEVGTPLIRIVPASAGEDGTAVTGKVLKAEKAKQKKIKPGLGTEFSAEDATLIVATVSGIPMRDGETVKVENILNLKTVNLATGHVHYDGNVVISGDVAEGMLVEASGDIFIGGFLESGTVKGGGEVTISQGIIGHSVMVEDENERPELSARVECKGLLQARYAQYAYLKTAGDIEISDQLLHCESHSTSLMVGAEGQRNSKLVGGRVFVKELVRSGHIGCSSYVKTYLDFSPLYAPIAEDKGRLIELIDQAKNVRSELADKRSIMLKNNPDKQKDLELINSEIEKVDVSIVSYQEELKVLRGTVDGAIKKVTVIVGHELFPGVEVLSGKGEKDVITAEHAAGTFKLNEGKLLFQK